MKTPMQELVEKLKSQKERQISLMKNQLMIDAVDAVFTYAIENAESMLEKEKERMCEFAEYTRKCGFLSDQRGLMTTEELYDETFNNKEK